MLAVLRVPPKDIFSTARLSPSIVTFETANMAVLLGEP
jgi:hypothetical protein